uniref:DUF11 domain-containing protein n=1 Tax=viral metagenome TaxID=1070528 RepID=A0A6M3LAJ4_9ZZZZ
MLQVVEGMRYQSASEEIIYKITTTNWGSSPTTISAVVYDEKPFTDVTTTVLPTNTPTASGDVITLSPLKLLTKGHTYRVEVKFTSSSSIWECFFRVYCEI